MNKTCVIYGSSTGTCQDLASRIGARLGVDAADVIDVSTLKADQVAAFDNLILGTSTWGAGELQDDWYDGLTLLRNADLNGKVIALFGCGDSASYGDTFCNAMAEIYNGLKDCGARFVGRVSADGYSYDDSDAVVDGVFVGLPLDEVNEDDKTDSRIDAWVDAIKPEL